MNIYEIRWQRLLNIQHAIESAKARELVDMDRRAFPEIYEREERLWAGHSNTIREG